jgi:hypothetical protein
VAILHVIPQEHAPMMVTWRCVRRVRRALPVFRDGGGPHAVRPPRWRPARSASWGPSWMSLSCRLTGRKRVPCRLPPLSDGDRHRWVRAPKVAPRPAMHASTQLPCAFVSDARRVVRVGQGLASRHLGAFAAGMIVGQATRGKDGRPLREKIEASRSAGSIRSSSSASASSSMRPRWSRISPRCCLSDLRFPVLLVRGVPCRCIDAR